MISHWSEGSNVALDWNNLNLKLEKLKLNDTAKKPNIMGTTPSPLRLCPFPLKSLQLPLDDEIMNFKHFHTDCIHTVPDLWEIGKRIAYGSGSLNYYCTRWQSTTGILSFSFHFTLNFRNFINFIHLIKSQDNLNQIITKLKQNN